MGWYQKFYLDRTDRLFRGMIAASSVPNLSTFQQESPKKTKKYRIETDSETPYMSDVDYRYIDYIKAPM